jgi:hypothetical protein
LEANQDKKFMKPHLNRRIVIQACLSIKQDPISKITNLKRTGGVAQVVENLPSKCEALNSTTNT